MTAYTRPYLYPKQMDAFFHGKRYGLTEASTKAGKTVAAIAWILEIAFGLNSGDNVWWVAPISGQSEIAFRRIKRGLTQGTFVAKESPEPKITLLNGVTIWFKSGDKPDSLFGEDVYAAVIDEASRVKEESWWALRSTLTATRGPINIIGNVKGRKNWFYNLARQAEKEIYDETSNMHYSKMTVLDAIDAGVITDDEMRDAKKQLPEHVFKELYMAEPADDGGNPFGINHIEACTVDIIYNSKAVAYGIDLAKKQDYFVIIGLDREGNVCEFHRWQHIPWRESINRTQVIVGEDTPALVDSTGVGDPVLEQMQIGHGNIRGFTFSSSSKQRLMEGLAVSIQGRELTFPKGPISIELESYEYVYTSSGVKYSAPEGMHDDCVCALALARQKWAEIQPGQNLMDYYHQNALLAHEEEQKEVIVKDDLSFLHRDIRQTLIENELTELYHATCKQYELEARGCFKCKKPVTGLTKITDAWNIWHVECYG
jgi:hypothetical protein